MAGPGKPGQKKRFTDEELAERNRTAVREARRKATFVGQNIAPIPPVKNWERRNACKRDLKRFMTTYLGPRFHRKFSEDHEKSIKKGEQAILRGGLFAQACPRGDGKTERCKAKCVWAILYGHRKFVLMIGATITAATDELLDGVRAILEDREGEFPLLYEDFPDALHAVRRLEGETKRQRGQHCDGLRTRIRWGSNYLVMPTVPDGDWIDGKTLGPSPCAGATVRVTGITGRLRGFNIDGVRPDFIIPDDPQTDESAASLAGNAKIERILSRAVIGLGGQGKRIAGIMPCTVIEQGDAIDNILTHEKHPEWDSERTRMLYSFPKRMDLWEKYRDIRNDYNPNLGAHDKQRAEEAATLFYLENAEAMQQGARVAWPERYNEETELDGLQCCMNLFFQDLYAFWSEFQNSPLPIALGDVVEMTALEIAAKVNRVPRDVVPLGASRLTAFIDVQQRLLYYVVCAWAEDFTGWVIDYGSYPDQKRRYFTLADATKTLNKLEGVETGGVEAQVFAGLDQLTKGMLGMEWKGETGATHRVERCLVDSGWNSELVYHFCRRSQFAQVLLPSKGAGIGASNKSITDHQKKPGERIGLEWYLPVSKETRGVRLLHYDTNFWKSFLMARLAVPIGGKGALTLFGDDQHAHRMLADHLTSEYRIRVGSLDPKRSGRIVDEWKLKPGAPDNHLFDCLVGCTVAASFQGVSLADVHKSTKPVALPPVDYAAQYARARAGW
jgi:hypothetical protein